MLQHVKVPITMTIDYVLQGDQSSLTYFLNSSQHEAHLRLLYMSFFILINRMFFM